MTEQATANPAQTVIKVKHADLPLCCPDKAEDAAALHPRVFLPIEKSGRVVCPYCGAIYQLAD
jgi:uncharacterized Zn-finger protein